MVRHFSHSTGGKRDVFPPETRAHVKEKREMKEMGKKTNNEIMISSSVITTIRLLYRETRFCDEARRRLGEPVKPPYNE